MRSQEFSLVRGRLILAADWLAPVYGALEPETEPGLALPETDGARFFCDPDWLAEDVRARGGAGACAALLHCAAHCLLGHVFERDPDPVAADMAAALLTEMLIPEFCPARGDPLYLEAKRHLTGIPLNGVAGAMSADSFFSRNREALAAQLKVDGHGRWVPGDGRLPRVGGPGGGWAALRRRYAGYLRRGRIGLAPGSRRERAALGAAPSRDYFTLLRRYAALREEPREDPDAFEYGLYAYGLRQWGNMPLIEPAETREARRLDELAIVIDTSGSCVESLTARFLNETRALVADERLFARRFNLRILQCDARVQRDDLITCARDFERYIDALEIVGGGGTDFRPAFERIDRLVARGAFRRLPAALFFSDGMGLFPQNPPGYETVFVFYEGQYDAIDVPKWAKQLVLHEESEE